MKQLHGAPVVPHWDLCSVSLLGKPCVRGTQGEMGFVDPCEPMDIVCVIPMSSPCCNLAVPYAIGRGLGSIAEGESQTILKNRKRRLGTQHGQGWELTCGCQGKGGHLELPQMFPWCSIHVSYRDIHPQGWKAKLCTFCCSFNICRSLRRKAKPPQWDESVWAKHLIWG